MEKMLTVITPFYNAEQFLSDYFKTILQQPRESLEAVSFVWIDDGSTDDTFLELKHFIAGQDLDIQLLKVEINSGPSIARNKGVQVTKTKWITYLDADDSWSTNALRILLVYTRTDFDIVFSAYSIQQSGANIGVCSLKPILDRYNLRLPDLLERQNTSVPLGVMHTKDIYEQAGGFPPYIICGEDGILWRRMVCNENARYVFNEQIIGSYVIRQNGQSRTNRRFSSGKHFAFDDKNPLGPNGQYLDGLSIEELEQLLELSEEGIPNSYNQISG